MTRAVNVVMQEAEVLALCARKSIAVSAIEVLPSGGTHLVCVTMDGADQVRRLLRKSLIEGRVKRFPFQRAAGASYI
ncbi:hypothetical protein Saro_3076 [Novosphingobium aromaticivorans DSM 12444]|uniref:Uncharacterized protein n=1 Tax=Novosphingobium aromaticivorans (strain ATCC 700278 / DSM 12444 / CCUG 56034 / CIP 105152 / NBRC 16084 / F199) TaxID=279238 RepID=Q2G3R2_NOVAD|nr:hypothetical protein [Novosphingobium aromaticivorans]ABD27511.1 hypothetical protein Saro_3076 [Novosphingobium aromaticivorans DSM 12444]SCY70761.1 hypothetical protein SAMN05660666_02592 [Novosphingobium aromaticivorans]